jgi:hypothetical protein
LKGVDDMGAGNAFAVGAWAEGYVDGVDGIIRLPGVVLDLSNSAPKPNFTVGGYWVVECIDSDGNLVWETTAENGVTNAGINHLLNTEWAGGTQITSWYLGLIDGTTTPTLSPSDTMASHSGWSEHNSSDTSDANRILWGPTTSTALSLVNGTSCDYHMIPSSPVTIWGLFLVGGGTAANKGSSGSGDTLSATAPFSTGPQSCKNGDTLRSTYTMGGASN